MKKISIIALVFVLTAGLMTACRNPMNDTATNPSTESTAPSTVAPTMPTTEATTPTQGTTAPGSGTINPGDGTIDGSEPGSATDATGDNTRRRTLPRY